MIYSKKSSKPRKYISDEVKTKIDGVISAAPKYTPTPSAAPEKYAKGGYVDETEEMTSRPDKGWGAIIVKNKMAEGGEVKPQRRSIADAIMAKRAMADQLHQDADDMMMAEGGQIDIANNGKQLPSEFNQRNEAALKENYDSGLEDIEQPEDSNEIGDSDEDKNSIVDAIMRKRRSK